MRFYSLHFILPFVLAALSVIHICILHIEGSSSPLGIENFDYVSFLPYFYIKDAFSVFLILFFLYIYLVFFNPNKLGDSLNYIQADSSKTPIHIVPEWYFLPFYGMLRCIPNKVLGILCMGVSIAIFFLLPFLPIYKIPTRFDIFHKFFVIYFISHILLFLAFLILFSDLLLFLLLH